MNISQRLVSLEHPTNWLNGGKRQEVRFLFYVLTWRV